MNTSTAGDLDVRAEAPPACTEERIVPITTARLGVLLGKLRESHHLALRDVALVPELRTELDDIEAGRRRPDPALLDLILDTYGASLDELLSRRETLVVVDGTEKEVLTRYLAAVRGWRGSARHPQLREADFKVLAGILGTDLKSIRKRLQRHAIEERIAPLGTARLGYLVKRLLESGRITRDEDAPLPEAVQSQLDDIQAGRVRPDIPLLELLLKYCGAGLDELVSPRETLVVIEGTDKEVLTRYLAAMRRWRGSGKHTQLREADLKVLAEILGTDPKDIQQRLKRLTGCSRRRARRLTVMLLAGIAIGPAVASFVHSPNPPAPAGIQSNARLDNSQLVVAVGIPVSVHNPVTVKTPAIEGTVAAHAVAADCATALAYLSAHAKPGFAHYCRPGKLTVGLTNAVAYTCVPGPTFACPDGNAEIIIADPACAQSYENEASNSYWDFSTGGVIQPGATQDGRTWDPFGTCP